jgi:transcription-repair coupling factor (superfamily II helicase)
MLLSELRAGDPVVRAARHRALPRSASDPGEGAGEFLLLEYADENKLYVPVAQLHSIGATGGRPSRRHCKLGGDQ